MSKQFTAASIVAIWRRKESFSLDDDVRKYIPELPDFGLRSDSESGVAPHQWLPDSGNYWKLVWVEGFECFITDDDVMSVIAAAEGTEFKPGERYVLLNTCYRYGLVRNGSAGLPADCHDEKCFRAARDAQHAFSLRARGIFETRMRLGY